VLWHCWLGHLTRKIVSKMTYNVWSEALNPTIPIPEGLLYYRQRFHWSLKVLKFFLVFQGLESPWKPIWSFTILEKWHRFLKVLEFLIDMSCIHNTVAFLSTIVDSSQHFIVCVDFCCWYWETSNCVHNQNLTFDKFFVAFQSCCITVWLS